MSIDPLGTAPLFDLEAEPAPAAEDLSPQRRRTIRQRDLIRSGMHPLAALTPALRLHPDASRSGERTAPGPKCGGCPLVAKNEHGYLKCGRGPAYAGHGAASDLRLWWPACEHYQGVTP